MTVLKSLNTVINLDLSGSELKMAKESNDLAKVLLEPTQKSNELSMNTKCGQRLTPDGRRHKRKF